MPRLRLRPEAPFFALAHSQCGWRLTAPGRWQRGHEVIFRRSPGVWYWYPDGLSGTRAIGPFKTMKGARLRALRGASSHVRGLEDR